MPGLDFGAGWSFVLNEDAEHRLFNNEKIKEIRGIYSLYGMIPGGPEANIDFRIGHAF